MAIKDYWIYQRRDVQDPWALYVVKEFDRRNYKESICLDYTFYHESIPNATHSISFVGLHCDTIPLYVEEITAQLVDYTTFDNLDYQQLKTALEDIIFD